MAETVETVNAPNTWAQGKPAVIIQVVGSEIIQYNKEEILGLAKTAGYTVHTYISQNAKNVNARYFLGKGKMQSILAALDVYFGKFDPKQPEIDPQHDELMEAIQNLETNDLTDIGDRENSAFPKGVEPIDLQLPPGIEVRKEIAIIFNNRLGNMQVLTLGKEWGTKVIDRDELVLEIFDRNARTRESRLQIELARLALQSNLMKKEIGQHLDERQGRDFMGKGMPGWAPVARAFTSKRKKIMEDLEEIAKGRAVRRRKRGNFFNVGIIGYTNAGKTTLLNRLAKDNLETANQEFTTVSPTSRKMTIPKYDEEGRFHAIEIIITDSVGFIFDMSHLLIEAFLSTLEELQFSDLIVIVLDLAESSEARLFTKLETCFNIIGKIGATSIPKLLLFNKIDLISAEIQEKRTKLVKERFPDIPFVAISALNKTGLQQLTDEIVRQQALLWGKRLLKGA